VTLTNDTPIPRELRGIQTGPTCLHLPTSIERSYGGYLFTSSTSPPCVPDIETLPYALMASLAAFFQAFSCSPDDDHEHLQVAALILASISSKL
jgi:hypothetical protein